MFKTNLILPPTEDDVVEKARADLWAQVRTFTPVERKVLSVLYRYELATDKAERERCIVTLSWFLKSGEALNNTLRAQVSAKLAEGAK